MRRAFSVVEATLGLGLTSLLMVVAFFAFEKGVRSWKRTDQTRDLVEGARLVAESLEKDVQRSCYSSLSCQGEALSLAHALDSDGRFQLDAHGNPQWLGYLIFYRDGQKNAIIRRDEKLATPLATALPIETGLGAALNTRLGAGRRLAEQVQAFEVAVVDQRLDYRLRCLRPAHGHQPATPFTLEGSCRFRNR